MKKTVLRYGGYSALFELICFVLAWLILTLFKISISVQGNIGWLAITCPLIFIYFGIRYQRDVVSTGHISFLQGVKTGLMIALLPSFFYALIETIYVLFIDPDFYARITRYEIADYQKTLSPAAFAAKMKELQHHTALDKNPLFNFSIMVLTIMSLGTIITLISSLLLMRRAKKEAVS